MRASRPTWTTVVVVATTTCLCLLVNAGAAPAKLPIPLPGVWPRVPAHHATTSHKSKKRGHHRTGHRSHHGPRGPQGIPGPAGPPGLPGPPGSAGPGATKFYLYEAPTSNDQIHPLLTVGPFRLGIACQPGEEAGAIKFIVSEQITETLNAAEFGFNTTNGKAVAFDFDATTAAQPPTQMETVVKTAERSDTAGDLVVNANGTTTWLEIFYGAIGSTYQAGTPAHCYMGGIEL